MRVEKQRFEDVSPIKRWGIFRCYVSLLEGMTQD